MSAFTADFAARFALAADASGMRIAVRVRPKDCAIAAFDLRAAFDRPNTLTGPGGYSTDWSIEYVATDAPLLAEDDEVEVGEQIFKVREKPRASERAGDDGTFRVALLTRIEQCED